MALDKTSCSALIWMVATYQSRIEFIGPTIVLSVLEMPVDRAYLLWKKFAEFFRNQKTKAKRDGSVTIYCVVKKPTESSL